LPFERQYPIHTARQGVAIGEKKKAGLQKFTYALHCLNQNRRACVS
tara:strand:- start:4363 stop:4500 length:138 start_codon:yes stop_codon:yes gene_type:complete